MYPRYNRKHSTFRLLLGYCLKPSQRICNPLGSLSGFEIHILNRDYKSLGLNHRIANPMERETQRHRGNILSINRIKISVYSMALCYNWFCYILGIGDYRMIPSFLRTTQSLTCILTVIFISLLSTGFSGSGTSEPPKPNSFISVTVIS